MEDTLRVSPLRLQTPTLKVLILVLMEDTLRVVLMYYSRREHNVLILVLMEDTLRVRRIDVTGTTARSLNPCFNGRYSQRLYQASSVGLIYFRLNPCFNGRYSQRDTLMMQN